jgi:FkbM family methyltransferase
MNLPVMGKPESYFWKKVLRFLSACTRALTLRITVGDGKHKYLFAPKTNNDIFRYTTFFTKEEGTLEWVRKNVTDGAVFFDIGANVGLYSLYAAKNGNGVQVFSFEPHKVNFATLLENITLNRLEHSISPLAIALGSDAGFFHLNYNSMASGTSMSQLGHSTLPGDRAFVPKLKELVYSCSLDQLIASDQLPMPTMIKIDVDGNEVPVLSGMVNLLSGANGPRTLQIEINSGQNTEVHAIMERSGYVLDHVHFTKSGKRQFEKTKSYESIPHNAVFSKSGGAV